MSETTVAVRERPILMSAPMVRAILGGRKTQARRVVTGPLRQEAHSPAVREPQFYDQGRRHIWTWMVGDGPSAFAVGDRRCPYGQPGDRLWVREAWAPVTVRRDLPASPIFDAAPVRGSCEILYRATDDDGLSQQGFRWRPSIHMPRWASRITLELTEVRVERVQKVTEEDAIAEGVNAPRCERCGYTRWDARYHMDHALCGMPEPASVIPVFRELWDSINAKRGYGWNANPWVWVLSFAPLTPEEP